MSSLGLDRAGSRLRSCILVMLLCLAGAQACADPMDEEVAVAIGAQSLGESLRALAKQANLQVLFDSSLVTRLSARAVKGTMSPREALERLLMGTDLEAHEQAPGVIVIRLRPGAQPSGRTTGGR